MTTTTSFSNNRFMSMFKASLLRIRSLTIFYTIVAFVFFPLQYIMTMMSHNNYAYDIYSLNQFAGNARLYTIIASIFFVAIMVLMPLFVGAQLFGDMHNKKSVDLYHSLPVKRSTTLLAKMAAGMASMGFVIVVNYAIAMIAQQINFAGIAKNLELAQMLGDDKIIARMQAAINSNAVGAGLQDIVCWFAVLFALLAIMAFVCVQVGTTFDTVVLTLGAYGVLPVMYTLLLGLAQSFVYGFTADVNLAFLSNLSPIPSMVQVMFAENYETIASVFNGQYVNYYKCALIAVGVWFLIGIALTFVAIKIYENRKSEQAETTDTHGIFKIFLKICGTFVVAIASGFMFKGIFNGESYLYIGIMVGGILAYITMDIIFARSFKRVIKSMPGGIVVSLATAAVIVVMSNGALGYSTSLPKLDNIKSVTVNYRGPYGTYNEVDNVRYYRNTKYDVTLESKEAIEIVYNTHKTQVDLHKNKQYKNEYKNSNIASQNFSIVYTLSNGKTVARNYRDMYYDASDALIKLEANEEFVRKTHPAFRTTYDMAKGSITIYNSIGTGNDIKLNREQFDGLMTAISNDMLSRTYEDIMAPQPVPLGYIKINYIDGDWTDDGKYVDNGVLFSDGYYIVSSKSSYTINYLEKIGYAMESLSADSSRVEAILLRTYSNQRGNITLFQSTINDTMLIDDLEGYRRRFNDMKEYAYDYGEIFIEDEADIASIMRNAKSSMVSRDEYIELDILLTKDYMDSSAENFVRINYAIKRSDLPEHIQKKLTPYSGYYIDKYGNRDYNRIPEANAIGIIGGADGPTAIFSTTEKIADTAPTLQLQPEAVTDITIAKVK